MLLLESWLPYANQLPATWYAEQRKPFIYEQGHLSNIRNSLAPYRIIGYYLLYLIETHKVPSSGP